MLRLALALLVPSCTLYDGGSSAAVDDQPAPSDCEAHTATIFEPLDGATLEGGTIQTRQRWNEAGIPDRFYDVEDQFGNFFQTVGGDEVQGDGSIISHWGPLPRGGSFTFKVGWFCDAGTEHETTITLATVHFTTKP